MAFGRADEFNEILRECRINDPSLLKEYGDFGEDNEIYGWGRKAIFCSCCLIHGGDSCCSTCDKETAPPPPDG
tara:strand:- start:491 stop:709 length:219 start_codon:yes stop_codon:yes gene_type:complete